MGQKQLKPRILSALLTTATIRDAAGQAGTTERTIYKYLHDPEFLRELDAVNFACLQAAAGAVQRGMEDAINVLRAAMKDPDASPQARINAARTILDYGLRTYESLQILPRIEKLEQAAGDRWTPWNSNAD